MRNKRDDYWDAFELELSLNQPQRLMVKWLREVVGEEIVITEYTWTTTGKEHM